MRLMAGVTRCLFLCTVLLVLPAITTAQSDQDTIQRIEELEQWIRDHPGVFDRNVHNELRHLYSIKNPPDLRKSMVHANVILQHSIMDEYMLNILSGWQIGTDSPTARANLLMNAQTFPDLRFIAAASFLQIGDLYTAEGNHEEATSYYLEVAEDTSPDIAQYRILAEERLSQQGQPPGSQPPSVPPPAGPPPPENDPPENGGPVYEFTEPSECHTYDAQQPVPEGWGAAYDVFSAEQEVLLKATCMQDETRIAIGSSNVDTYIYYLAYQLVNNNWEQIELQCIGEIPWNNWCVGEATGVISAQSLYFLAYTCIWKGNIIDGSWACGCRDKQCAQSFWQLQRVGIQPPAPPSNQGVFAIPTSGYMGFGWTGDSSGSHRGIDIWTGRVAVGCTCSEPSGCKAAPGNEVKAAYAGTVEAIYWGDHSGSWRLPSVTNPNGYPLSVVVLKHTNVPGISGAIYTTYQHLANNETYESYVRSDLSIGATVKQHEIIGWQGNWRYYETNALITHLHFEVAFQAVNQPLPIRITVNPMPYLGLNYTSCSGNVFYP